MWTAAATAVLLITLTALVAIQPELSLADQAAVVAVHATGRPFVPAARWTSPIGGPVGVDIGTEVVAVRVLCRRALLPALTVVAVRLLELDVETVPKVAVARPRPPFPDPGAVVGAQIGYVIGAAPRLGVAGVPSTPAGAGCAMRRAAEWLARYGPASQDRLCGDDEELAAGRRSHEVHINTA